MHGEQGHAWLARLPHSVAGAAAKWGLVVSDPYPGLAYNWVAPAMRGEEPVVLKVFVPTEEAMREPLALKAIAGRGAARLLDLDAANGAMLLERLVPGEMLVGHSDAVRVTCEVMQTLWHCSPPTVFPGLADWTRSLDGPAAQGLPSSLLGRAHTLRESLLAGADKPVLLHGDLHPMNILSDGAGWRAIDPKGIVGEPAFDCAAFLINRPSTFREDLDLFARILKVERAKIYGWAFVYSLLSAVWTLEDHDVLDRSAIAFAEFLEASVSGT